MKIEDKIRIIEEELFYDYTGIQRNKEELDYLLSMYPPNTIYLSSPLPFSKVLMEELSKLKIELREEKINNILK
jgi:hypothetical protein